MGNKNNILDNSQLKTKKTINQNINQNKLFIGYDQKTKVSKDNFINDLDFSSSISSDSFNGSNYKKEDSIKNENNIGLNIKKKRKL